MDWDKGDKEILHLIKLKYKELINEDIPVTITKSSMGKATGVLAALEKNINKLPKTKKYLSEIIETVQQFQIRRCKKLIDDKLKNQEDIILWKIQREAGISTKDFKIIEEKVLKNNNIKNRGGKYEQNIN